MFYLICVHPADELPMLCEGGVYADREAAQRQCDSLNETAMKYRHDSRYTVRDSMDGVYVDTEVLSSLEPEQLAALPTGGDLAAAPIPPRAYAVQDGEMFYIHTDRAGLCYVAFRQAPIHVEYFNTEDAAKARAWLVAEYPATQFSFI